MIKIKRPTIIIFQNDFEVDSIMSILDLERLFLDKQKKKL